MLLLVGRWLLLSVARSIKPVLSVLVTLSCVRFLIGKGFVAH